MDYAALYEMHRKAVVQPLMTEQWDIQKHDGAGLTDMWLQLPAVHRLHMWAKQILDSCM